ncbi:kelch-like protein 10 [Austrofundulus limnaeus]|uniref:Kelch-like protein 10 n=1 Tax=Austrofundulus limnaeus TaxID=52670 RepID=A0A2I4AUK8_AUSLI|nr:PREDICTED: kelch-like protein 10 [Austrofundulus limnaeus]
MSRQDEPSVNPVLEELRLEDSLTDAVLKVDDVEFPVHKVVLCMHTEYFRAFFTRWSKPEQTVFPISGLSPDTMRRILDFMYTGSMSITETNAHETMIAADRFNMMGVMQACYEFFIGLLNPNNCVGIWKFTNVVCHPELRCKAFCCILEQFKEVVNCDEFSLLTEEELANIIERDDLNVQKESVIFEAVLKWIADKPEDRERHFSALFTKIRLTRMDVEYIRTTVISNNLVLRSKKCKSIVNTIIAKNIHRPVSLRRRIAYTSVPMDRPRMPSAILLAIGGWSGNNPTNAIEAYDIRADNWINVTDDFEQPRAYHGTAFLNGYVYCVGGFDRLEHFNNVRRFDPVTRTWLEVSPMYFRRCYVSVTVLNGRIYAMGGFDGQTRLNTAECYSPETNQWSLIEPMNEQRSDASCTTFQDRIYICGGFNGLMCLQTAEFYTPESNQWTAIAPMNVTRSGLGVIACEGHIYAIGGFDGHFRQDTAEAYNPRTNVWMNVASMNTPRSNFGIEVVEGCIFVVGGFNGVSTTFNVEFYDAATNTWTNAQDMEIFRSAVSCCTISRLPNLMEYSAAHQPQVEELEEYMESDSSH